MYQVHNCFSLEQVESLVLLNCTQSFWDSYSVNSTRMCSWEYAD